MGENASHALEVFENGTVSIRDLRLGEAMHSNVGPDVEADRVYIEQSDLKGRLLDGSRASLVLYDVGMGIAANSLAAIDCRSGLSAIARSLEIVSFENDLGGIRLALGNPERFPFLAKHLEKVRSLLDAGQWCSPDGAVRWTLRVGDFREQVLEPSAELVYFDFFSPKSAPELWEASVFEKIFASCKPGAMLLTYNAATRVRKAMTAAGFVVRKGWETEFKAETTVAVR